MNKITLTIDGLTHTAKYSSIGLIWLYKIQHREAGYIKGPMHGVTTKEEALSYLLKKLNITV